MRRTRNEALAFVLVAIAFVPLGDAEQTCLLSVGPTVRLHADAIHAGHFDEVLRQFVQHFFVPQTLVLRHLGVDVCKLRHRDRNHFCICIEFHGAGAERDHAVHQRVVLFAQLEHLSVEVQLTGVFVEDRMLQVVYFPGQVARDWCGAWGLGLVQYIGYD